MNCYSYSFYYPRFSKSVYLQFDKYSGNLTSYLANNVAKFKLILPKTCTLGNDELNQFNTIFIEPSEKSCDPFSIWTIASNTIYEILKELKLK